MQRINILVSFVMCTAVHGAQPDAPLPHPVPSIFESIANQPVVLSENRIGTTADATTTDLQDSSEIDHGNVTDETAAADAGAPVSGGESEATTLPPIVGPSPSLFVGSYEAEVVVPHDPSETTTVQSDLDSTPATTTALPVPAHEQRLLPPPTVTPEPDAVADDVTSDATSVFIPSDLTAWLRVGGALAIVIALMLLLRFVITRIGGPLAGGRAPSGLLDVLARYPIGRGRSIVILKVDRRVLVIHQTAEAANTLTEFTDGDEVAALLRKITDANGESTNRRFEAMLSRKKAEGILEDNRSGRGRKRDARDVSGNQAEGLIDIVDLTKQPRMGTVIA